MKATFLKEETIKSREQVNNVFSKGMSISKYPLLLKFVEVDELDVPAKVVITVSKKKFRSAVDRNRVKRLVRESYRRNKYILHEWLSRSDKYLLIAFIYTGKTIPDYAEVEKKLILILQTLIKSDGKTNR